MKNTNKLLSILLTLTLVLDLLPWSVLPARASWDGATIASEDDWDAFAEAVNRGESFRGKTVALTADITVSETVGTRKAPFSGIFCGGGHTLTFNRTTSSDDCAPFLYIDGAVFTCLNVAGTIRIDRKYAAGIAAHSYGDCVIQNCRSSIRVESSIDGDGTHAGFVAVAETGTLAFSNCLFDGVITGDDTTKCGGFVGWRNSKLTFANCLMAGTMGIDMDDDSAVFNRNRGADFTNCYYKGSFDYAEKQGTNTSASGEGLQGLLGLGWTVSGNAVVPTMDCKNLSTAVVSGLPECFPSIGSPIAVAYTVTAADGTVLTKDTDYTVTIKKGSGTVQSVQDAGDYTLTVTGKGSYTDSQTIRFTVVNPIVVSNADELASRMDKNGYIRLGADIEISETLTVINNVYITLDLNGHGIRMTGRGSVIRVSELSDLTLTDSNTGNLTHKYIVDSATGIATVDDNATGADVRTFTGGYVTGGTGRNNGAGKYYGGGVSVEGKCAFTLSGGTIIGNSAKHYGGGVFVRKNAVFTMDGGQVIWNYAGLQAGGVGANGARFTMREGNISDNRCDGMGGGVFINNTNDVSDFFASMSGGTVANNTAGKGGGGIYIHASQFILSGGSITGNLANQHGGGIRVDDAVLDLFGGSISDNTSACIGSLEGGGIYVGSHDRDKWTGDCVLNVKGAPVVSGNKGIRDGKNVEQNVYLEGQVAMPTINVVGKLTGADGSIGVTAATPGTFTNGLANGGTGAIACFASDDDAYFLVLSGSEAALTTASVQGGMISAPAGAKLIVATYDDSGKMTAVQSVTVPEGGWCGKAIGAIDGLTLPQVCKLMLVDGNFVPLCEAWTYDSKR